jgi:hypothetical protein
VKLYFFGGYNKFSGAKGHELRGAKPRNERKELPECKVVVNSLTLLFRYLHRVHTTHTHTHLDEDILFASKVKAVPVFN